MKPELGTIWRPRNIPEFIRNRHNEEWEIVQLFTLDSGAVKVKAMSRNSGNTIYLLRDMFLEEWEQVT